MPTIVKNIIQQPQPFDLVGDPVLIAGIGSGFEATLNWRVHDGHDERTGFFNVGAAPTSTANSMLQQPLAMPHSSSIGCSSRSTRKALATVPRSTR